MRVRTRKEFWDSWEIIHSSLVWYHEELLPITDEKWEYLETQSRYIERCKSVNEVEKLFRILWGHDERFIGNPLLSGSYEFAVYSLCYLVEEEDTITNMLNLFLPILNGYIAKELGDNFCIKVLASFCESTHYILWDIQELKVGDYNSNLFNWGKNLNWLETEKLARFLDSADLPALEDSDIPPREIYYYLNAYDDPFESDEEYYDTMRELSMR